MIYHVGGKAILYDVFTFDPALLLSLLKTHGTVEIHLFVSLFACNLFRIYLPFNHVRRKDRVPLLFGSLSFFQ